jgi:hypothetical protein
MKHSLTLASIDKLQATVDSATRMHRTGLVLFVLACVSVSLPRGDLPAWMPLAGLAATVLAFVIKAAGTLREIRVAGILDKVMDLPYRRGFQGRGSDASAWSAIRSYVLVSAVLTLAAALTPSMIATVGDTAYASFTAAICMGALSIQSFDNPRRLRNRIMEICFGRMDVHANEGGTLVA